jgi:trimeric autotransporter adhesin
MTPERQVSPVIRISRGERDASARATHLEAATRKFLVTTNERKQMSTKTNFKRIALVAVASLGLGVLSSVPSQASTAVPTITGVANGSGGVTVSAVADSLTAATLTLSSFMDTEGDSITVQVVPSNALAEATSVSAYLYLTDTGFVGTAIDTSAARQEGNTSAARVVNNQRLVAAVKAKSDTVGVTSGVTTGLYVIARDTKAATTGNVKASFSLQIDSRAADTNFTAGTYTYTVNIRSYDAGVATARSTQQTLSIVVARTAAATALLATAVNGGLSSVTLGNTVANLGTPNDQTSSTTADSSIAVASTASTDDVGFVRVRLRNTAGGNAQESVTATISAGRIGDGTTMGRSIVLPYTSANVTAGFKDLTVEADGSAGAASIVISTPSYTFPAKTVTFYADATDKITAATYASVIGASGIGVHGSQFDAAGNSWGAGTLVYAYSSDTTIISTYGTACTYNSTLKVALCTLAGVKNGTANITLRDASTVALSTKASNAVAVKVNLNQAASVALAFNKASYVPGEKATLQITVKDAAGATLPAATYTNLFATGGLVSSSSLTAVSSTVLGSVSVTTMANVAASTDTPIVTADPIGQITVFMPMAGGTVTLTGKGGTSLPTSGQVALTASATVTDNAAAALAAVTALATTVASLKTLITTLTNLVLKIQKKVKA